MSKKRKKNSHNKKHNRKQQQSLNWFNKMKSRVSFDPIKTFFIELLGKLKSVDMTLLPSHVKRYVTNNKKGVIFSIVMTAIVLTGYFGFVYPDHSQDSVVSVDLSQEQTSFMDGTIIQMKNLDQTRLETSLSLLGELLDEQLTEPVHLVVVGGSALLASGAISRTTGDVDVFARRGEVDGEIYSLTLYSNGYHC